MSSAHPGFAAVKAKIASKEGVSAKSAGAILGAASRHASAAAKHANPRLKRVLGKMHEGGMIKKSGVYEMQKGEMVIPKHAVPEMPAGDATKGPDYHFVSHTKDLDVAHVNEVQAFPNGSDATGIGHWEGDGSDIKFIS